jgi:AAA family ATP:ADP antiporter
VGDDKPTNPLRAVLNIRREELPLALLMFGYFFLVISTFWILKPIKKSLFIGFYKQAGGLEIFSLTLTGSQAEQIAKVLNMLVAFVAVAVFSWLSRRLVRQQLTLVFSAFFAVTFVLFGFTLSQPGAWQVWAFYLYGDLYSTIMVATFFVFLNDSVSPAAARRLYGLIVLGGVAGGVFGTSALRGLINLLSTPGWLWVCLVIALVIALLAHLAGRRVDANPPDLGATKPQKDEPGGESSQTAPGNPAIEGARLVFRSRYLLSIVAMVGLYEIVSTIMDFQFSATVEHYVAAGEAMKVHFATVFMITNIVSLVIQILFTSYLMSRFKLYVALLVLPAMAMLGSSAYMLLPILWVGSLLNTADNAFNYSINQSAREALYTATSRDEKYKAKAFIDMFVQRFAKAIAVGINIAVPVVFAGFASIRWLSAITVVVILLWAIAARFAGRRFHELAG